MLIIDGADCLGKTILAKKIVNKISALGLPVVYSWMTRPNEDKFGFFNEYKLLINPYAVHDRFHLSGLAYHNDKISYDRLQIINSWVRSVGGLIVLLYADDEQWYRKRIEADNRGNILNVNALCKANRFFINYANGGYDKFRYGLRGDVDYRFNILPCVANSKSEPWYVKDCDVDEMIEVWLHRRTYLGTEYI